MCASPFRGGELLKAMEGVRSFFDGLCAERRLHTGLEIHADPFSRKDAEAQRHEGFAEDAEREVLEFGDTEGIEF